VVNLKITLAIRVKPAFTVTIVALAARPYAAWTMDEPAIRMDALSKTYAGG
jgi:hypothetical protein